MQENTVGTYTVSSTYLFYTYLPVHTAMYLVSYAYDPASIPCLLYLSIVLYA